MKDKEFLYWVADRISEVYGESPNVDFVSKLKSIADSREKMAEILSHGVSAQSFEMKHQKLCEALSLCK